jgi:hypothetical protein
MRKQRKMCLVRTYAHFLEHTGFLEVRSMDAFVPTLTVFVAVFTRR